MANQVHTLRAASDSPFLDMENGLDDEKMHQQKTFINPQNTVCGMHTKRCPVMAPMTPPATPDKSAKRPKGQKATVSKMRDKRDRRIERQRTFEAEKKQRKVLVAADPFGSPVEEQDATGFTAALLREQFTQASGRQSAIQRAPTALDSQYSAPWFVQHQCKDLPFSSSDNTTQGDKDTSEQRAENKQSECRTPLAGGKTCYNYPSIHNKPLYSQIPFPEKVTVKNKEEEDDDEEAHEHELARLLTNLPPVQAFHTNVTRINRVLTQVEFDEDEPVLINDFVTTEPSVNATDIDPINAAYNFFLGLQEEQIDLSNRTYVLGRKIRRMKKKSPKLKKKAMYKLTQLERAVALTEKLGSQLFIAEYAWRDLVYQNKDNHNFDLGAALGDVQSGVELVINKFDRRIARTGYAVG